MPLYGIGESGKLPIEATQPFKDALEIIKQSNISGQILKPVTDELNAVTSALKQGIFAPDLSSRLHETFVQFDEHQRIMSAFGSSLVKPSIYESILSTPLNEQQSAINNLCAGLSPFVATESLSIDTTWLHDNNTWQFAKTALSDIDIAGLSKGMLSKLAVLEHETSLLGGSSLQKITSAVSQIVSIQEVIDPLPQITPMLGDLAKFAANQHLAIQKNADDPAEVEWRLEAIDAASKFVDRQVMWTESFVDEVADAYNADAIGEDYGNSAPSPISQIGYHIGYSKRKNSNVSPKEALEHSTIVEITEKGKMISEKIVSLNRTVKDFGKEDVFKYTDKVVSGAVDLSTKVCLSEANMGSIVDALYFIFYENLERIKAFVGDGDKQAGDQLIRRDTSYQCIFDIKTIRSDYRHDLDHGSESKIKKQRRSIGDCYKRYCGQRPTREKDYKTLQRRLFDEILILMDKLLDKAATMQDYEQQ